MNPIRWALLALAIIALVAAPAVLRGCAGPDAPTPTSAAAVPTSSEARATESSTRAEAATRALLGQADVQGERADSLARMLAAERSRTSSYRVALVSARARLDSALVVAGVRPPSVSADTSRPDVVRADSDLNQLLAARIVTERVAADLALDQCEAQAARAASAYAAADSALAALSYTRLAYVEADRRATVATRLASHRTRQRNVLLGVAGVALGCTAGLLLIR